MPPQLPRSADVVVVGGGTAGAVVAGRLAERGDRDVLVLEAGPDYGAFADGGWPKDLLDAKCLATSHHDWGYRSRARYGERELPLERARVIMYRPGLPEGERTGSWPIDVTGR